MFKILAFIFGLWFTLILLVGITYALVTNVYISPASWIRSTIFVICIWIPFAFLITRKHKGENNDSP